MKAEELMIGDWVMNTHNQKPEQVREIRERMVMLDYNDLYDYDEIEPISLTPEILEKNGFEKVQNLLVLQWENGVYPSMIFVEYNPVNYCLFINDMMFPKPVRFLHELHHILMDCGIEKEITL